MSIETKINRTDHWFVGEDKVLQFTVVNEQDVAGWTVRFDLHAQGGDYPRVLTAGGLEVRGTNRVHVIIGADQTRDLPPGTYNFNLRRTDPGYEQVLAFGTAVLRSDVRL